MTLAAIGAAPFCTTPSAIVLFLVTSAITLCLGHSLGLHRLLIHRSFEAPRWLERAMVYLGTLVGMAGPLGMVRLHDLRDWAQRQQACHDLHAHRRPLLHDAWWQMHCRLELDRPPSFNLEPQLSRDRFMRALEATWMLQQLPWAALFFAVGGWPWLVWGVPVRVAVSVTGHWFVGHLTHRGGSQGWRVDGVAVQGHDLPQAALITFGEAWHGNHHAWPESARLGLEPGQHDPGWWVLLGLRRLGLVSGLREPADLQAREGLRRVTDASEICVPMRCDLGRTPVKRLGPFRFVAASLAVFASQHVLLLAILTAARGDVRHLPWWFWINPVRALVSPTVISQVPAGAATLGMAVTLVVDVVLVRLAFRRAKEVEGRSWAAALTIVPIVQIGAIVSLALARDYSPLHSPTPTQSAFHAKTSAWGVLLGVGLIVAAVAGSTLIFGVYGYALFLISPFLIAVAVAYLANRERRLTSKQTFGLVCAAFLLGAAALLGFAFEGVVCLVLASPIIAVAGLLGAWLGRSLVTLGRRGRGTTLTSVAFIPILIVAEAVLPPRATFENVERIDVAAPPSAVWKAVVHMSPLTEPPGAPFRWGLAYPLRGEIVGDGVGALRRSVFSTGDAVERVTVWRPGKELSFAVLQEPPAMRELSPYPNVNAPHRSGYFRTREVTFSLTPLPPGGTRLTLASQHDLDLEPALYWTPMARWAVRSNKLRVLQHLRRQAEEELQVTSRSMAP